MWRDQLAPTVI
jgi:hypothetical protein